MSKKARTAKKVRRHLTKAWRNANLDKQLQKKFETFLMFGEVWSPRQPSVAELTAQNVSLVKISLEPFTLIREKFASTKKLQNNVLDLIFTRNETDSNKQ